MPKKKTSKTPSAPAVDRAAPCSSWRHYGQDIHHNDTVRCKSLSAMRGRDVIGRVVQVRLGCGQFGSDVVFLRMADERLETVENEWFEKCDSSFPPTSYDTTEDTYTIGGEWPESGFIVGAPKQPQRAGSFTIIVAETNRQAHRRAEKRVTNTLTL